MDCDIYPEPVEEWSKYNLLANAMRHPFAFLFELQIRIMTSLFSQRRDPSKQIFSIYERSLHSAKHVFQKVYSENNIINPSQEETLNKLYEIFLKERPQSDTSTTIIYIELSPEECKKRIEQRQYEQNSDIESDRKIDEKYLEQLDQKYKEVMSTYNKKKLVILDGKLDKLTLARTAANILIKTPPIRNQSIDATDEIPVTTTASSQIDPQSIEKTVENPETNKSSHQISDITKKDLQSSSNDEDAFDKPPVFLYWNKFNKI